MGKSERGDNFFKLALSVAEVWGTLQGSTRFVESESINHDSVLGCNCKTLDVVLSFDPITSRLKRGGSPSAPTAYVCYSCGVNSMYVNSL